jgi:hypothetical protein
MEDQAVWHPRVEVTKHRDTFASLSEGAALYNRLYSRKIPRTRRRTDHENWLLYDLYCLYSEIKIAAGGRPAIAGPLYRFTRECMGLLGEDLRMKETAFRMRVKRLANKRLLTGSLASVLMNIT